MNIMWTEVEITKFNLLEGVWMFAFVNFCSRVPLQLAKAVSSVMCNYY